MLIKLRPEPWAVQPSGSYTVQILKLFVAEVLLAENFVLCAREERFTSENSAKCLSLVIYLLLPSSSTKLGLKDFS